MRSLRPDVTFMNAVSRICRLDYQLYRIFGPARLSRIRWVSIIEKGYAVDGWRIGTASFERKIVKKWMCTILKKKSPMTFCQKFRSCWEVSWIGNLKDTKGCVTKRRKKSTSMGASSKHMYFGYVWKELLKSKLWWSPKTSWTSCWHPTDSNFRHSHVSNLENKRDTEKCSNGFYKQVRLLYFMQVSVERKWFQLASWNSLLAPRAKNQTLIKESFNYSTVVSSIPQQW